MIHSIDEALTIIKKEILNSRKKGNKITFMIRDCDNKKVRIDKQTLKEY